MNIEMHCHTTCSDGVLTPSELIAKAAACGLTHISVTDHDSVAAYRELRDISLRGLCLIPGIEVSARHDGMDIHMLGYYIDPFSPTLDGVLEDARAKRAARTVRIIEKLEQGGYDISVDRFEREGLTLNRSNIARMIANNGEAESFDQVFRELIGQGCPFYVEKDDMAPEEAIRLIHEVGGIAVIAHARHYGVEHLIPLLAEKGLDGVECYHSEQDSEDERVLLAIAHDLGLLVTGGSDYHGDAVHPSSLGGNQPGQEDIERFLAVGHELGFGEM